MMSKKMAISFLASLHKIEKDLRGNLFKLDELQTVQEIRKIFLTEYRQSTGA